MRHVLIVGASGGIGLALVSALVQRFSGVKIIATYCHSDPRTLNYNASLDDYDLKSNGLEHVNDHSVDWVKCDLGDEKSILTLVGHVQDFTSGNIDLIINAVGILHTNECQPEKSLKQLDQDFFLKNMQMNVLPSLLLAKHLYPLLRKALSSKKYSCSIFATISAKVGSIEDNRLGGWTSYRCSKAALNMALKNISIEWRRTLPKVCVLALHPGTTDTSLSKPFQSNVPKRKLFSPQQTAHYLLDVLVDVVPEDTGSFFSWDGEKIPW